MYSRRQSQGWQNTSKTESARWQHSKLESKGSKKKHFKLSALKLFAKARVPVLAGRVLQGRPGIRTRDRVVGAAARPVRTPRPSSITSIISGPMLVPPYYVTESPRDDWDDRTTEAYSDRSSRKSSPTLSVNDPSEQGAALL